MKRVGRRYIEVVPDISCNICGSPVGWDLIVTGWLGAEATATGEFDLRCSEIDCQRYYRSVRMKEWIAGGLNDARESC